LIYQKMYLCLHPTLVVSKRSNGVSVESGTPFFFLLVSQLCLNL
jgi:hypothetical protein